MPTTMQTLELVKNSKLSLLQKYYTVFHPTEGRRLSWPEQTAGYQPGRGRLQWTRQTSNLQLPWYNYRMRPTVQLQPHYLSKQMDKYRASGEESRRKPAFTWKINIKSGCISA